jgi:hypothetical protein
MKTPPLLEWTEDRKLSGEVIVVVQQRNSEIREKMEVNKCVEIICAPKGKGGTRTPIFAVQ